MSTTFSNVVKRLVELQRPLFEVMLFILFVAGVYDVLDHALHLTEKFNTLAMKISTYMGW